jgi:hypothetical protein
VNKLSKKPTFCPSDSNSPKQFSPPETGEQEPQFSLSDEEKSVAQKWADEFQKEYVNPEKTKKILRGTLTENGKINPQKFYRIKKHIQRIILLITAFILALMLLFPPFHVSTSRKEYNWGYNFILNPPREGKATINSETLIVQCLIVIVIGIICWFAFKEKK